MKTNFRIILIAVHLLCAIFSVSLTAAEIQGAKFPDSVSEQGKNLVLNGLGVRTYWSFNVYAAALYQESKNQNPSAILDSKAVRVLRMFYFRDVGQGDALKVWKKSFQAYCPDPCEKFKQSMDQFYAQISSIEKGQEATYVFSEDTVEIRSKTGTTKIMQPEFPKIVLSTWIGQSPPTEKLKQGLLGK